MEADVAIQHAPEKWTPGESRYEQPEKVTYIYGSQKKGKETRAVSRLHVKPSKSYDNELEASVGRDTEVGSEAKVNKVKDDLSLGFGNRPDKNPETRGGRVAQPRLQFSPHAISETSVITRRQKESSCDSTEVCGHKKVRYNSKSGEMASHKPRYRHPLDYHQTDLRVEEIQGQKSTDSHSSKKRPIPVEFHLKEDQLPMSGPTAQYKRPINLSSPFSSMSPSSKEKPSSLVILEVKDGPTFFYKPSDRMVSDLGIGDETMIPSHGCFSQAAAGHALSGNLESYSRTSSTSAYTGNFSFSNPENFSLSAFRRDSSPGLHHMGPFSIGAAVHSSEDSPKYRSAVSHLPRTPGLRKPDLSVLSTPQKCKTNFPEDAISSEIRDFGGLQLHNKQQTMTKVLQSLSVSASVPISSALTLSHSPDVLPPKVLHPSMCAPKHDPNTDSNNSEQKAAVPDSNATLLNKSKDYVMPSTLTVTALDASCGFQNTSEIQQQKAGIKHDDIVVGPMRPRSVVNQGDTTGVPDNNSASVKFDVLGPGTAHMKPKDHAVLSLSTDGLSSGQPILSLKGESPKRGEIHSTSDFSIQGMSKGDSKTKFGAQKCLLSQDSAHKDAGKPLNSEPHSLLIDEATDRPSMSRRHTDAKASNIVDSGLESEKGRKPSEKKTEHQRPQHRKNMSGHVSDLTRTRTANATIQIETAAAYKTKSLDRHYKSVDGTKLVSKSANVSPAKQQLHSPKSKSSTSIPTKRLPTSSKLHMLSNIPVPISHDPPAKRHSYHRPPSTPEPAEIIVPSACENKFVCVTSDSPNHRNVSKLKSSETALISPIPPVNTVPSGHSSAEAPVDGTTQAFQCSKLPLNSHMTLATASVRLNQTTARENENIKPRMDLTNEHNSVSTSSQTEAIWNQPSTAAVVNAQKPSEPVTDSPCHIPVKPRLHRSAEHLLGDTKLTVFKSADNVPVFENSESSSSRTFQDSAKSETAGGDNISPLKKNHCLAKIGIMRRGSDRTEMYRRGSDRSILPVNQNDPSVEDLKKATSLKELCQSMASLLNIDNVKAAEMITTSLSQRQDLVEGLDADAILDYLSHHGVLDPGILVGLDNKASNTQRNSAILKHVEEHGNTAVALFINALRQSGQLHLASSLDTEQRIKPVSGNGYFGKDRHKGELTVRIEVEALKIIAPREPRSEKIVDTSLLGSPARQTLDDTGVVIKDDEDDFVKPRSCWCLCFSYKSKTKSASKKDSEKQKKSDLQKQGQRYPSSSPEKESKPSEEINRKNSNTKPHRTKSQEKTKKGKEILAKVAVTEGSKKDCSKAKDKDSSKKSKSSKSKSKVCEKYSVPSKTDESAVDQHQDFKSVPEIAYHVGTEASRSGGQRATTGESGTSKMTLGLRPYMPQLPQTVQLQSYNGVGGPPSIPTQSLKPDKDSWDPIIMEYDPKLELIKLRAGQEELASPTRQSGNIGIMCEQWKSNGRHFQQKASQLCERIVQELHTEIIKYFEQDRGTLVLDVVIDGSSILVINICMMRVQVKRLQQEIADDSLLNKIQDMFFSRVNIADFDIRGIKLRIVLDEQELNVVLSELS